MENKKTDLIEIFTRVMTILAFVLLLISIYWLILKLTNHSPTADQLLVMIFSGIGAVLAIMFGFLYNVTIKLNRLDATFKLEMRHTNEKIHVLASEIKELRTDLKNLTNVVYQKL